MKAKIKIASARRKMASSPQKKLFSMMKKIQVRAQTVTPLLKAIVGYPLQNENEYRTL